jgi:NADH-quinone oxidoreductase subunit D
MSTEPGVGLPIADEAREALEVARREGRDLTETERAIAGAEAMTTQEALASIEALQERDPGTREPMVINLGPQHPSTHGVLRLVTELDGEVIRDLHPVIGYLHTGIEKQCENKMYWQAITLVTRMDYLASFFNIHAYTSAVEKLLDLTVPDRAQYIRVIMSELNRISSHLVWLGTSGLELGAITVFFYSYREREKALDLMEMIAGERMNTRFFQVGGCSDDMPPGFEERVRAFLKEMPGRIDEYEGLLTENPIWIDRTKGVGVLPADQLIDLGVTGPALRAAGVDLDLR